MKRKLFWIVTLVLIVACLVASCKTGASWTNQKEDERGSSADILKANGSEKYIVFAALDDSGDLIASGDESATAAYAVVGYTGLVSELVVPSSYASRPVTKILAAYPYASYKCFMNGASYTGEDARLQNNVVVTSIAFGGNVVYVGAGVCAGMTSLTSVYFGHVQAGVTLGSNAFAACPLLGNESITYKAA